MIAVNDADGDLRRVPARWTAARHADVKALVNIESSFYKLVGGRKLGVLDPAFLRLVVHIAFGEITLFPLLYPLPFPDALAKGRIHISLQACLHHCLEGKCVYGLAQQALDI